MGVNGRRRMFLSEIGNRRSRTARVATGAALAATFFGTMRVGWATSAPARAAAPPSASVSTAAARRVRPVSLDDLSGKVPSDALWKLFDGDAATGLDVHGDVRLRMTFSEPIAVTAVGGFGVRDGQLVLHGPSGVTGGETAGAGGPGWTRWRRSTRRPRGPSSSSGLPADRTRPSPSWRSRGRLEGEAEGRTRPLADALFDPSRQPPAGTEVFSRYRRDAGHFLATAPPGTPLLCVPVTRAASSVRFSRTSSTVFLNFTAAVCPSQRRHPVGGFAALAGCQREDSKSRRSLLPPCRPATNIVEFSAGQLGESVGLPRQERELSSPTSATPRRATRRRRRRPSASSSDWQRAQRIRSGTLASATPHQLHELRCRSPSGSPALVVAAGSVANRHSQTIDLGGLAIGSQVVPLQTSRPSTSSRSPSRDRGARRSSSPIWPSRR